MPRLWNDTIEEHRRSVRDATLDATASLVAEHGLLSVTMSEIAHRTGVGRATLYKYFPDVESILLAWHERQVTAHLDQLARVMDQAGTPGHRLHAVLTASAVLAHGSSAQHGTELAAALHRDDHVARAEQRLHDLVRDLLSEAATAGDVRGDVPPVELATYCLSALAAARALPTKAAVHRLVTVTLAGVRPPGPGATH